MMINSIHYDKHVHYGMLRKLISTGAIFQYAKMILVGSAKTCCSLYILRRLIVKSIVFVRSSDC